MIKDSIYPSVRKFRAFTVRLDGTKILELRKRLKLSLEQLANRVNISRGTLYRYEHGAIEASEENAKVLERVLKAEIRKPIDPFEERQPVSDKTMLSMLGFASVKTSHAPFDIAGKEREFVIAGEKADPRTLKKRAEVYRQISDMFHAEACFILSNSARAVGGIPVISPKELSAFKRAKELLDAIEERKEN